MSEYDRHDDDTRIIKQLEEKLRNQSKSLREQSEATEKLQLQIMDIQQEYKRVIKQKEEESFLLNQTEQQKYVTLLNFLIIL
jgi:hypothetical protein